MNPDTLWHYKRLLRQIAYDLRYKARRVDVQALAAGWDCVGVDISYWQGAVDFAKLKSKVSYAYIRAGYGNDFIDPRCDEYRAGCTAVGLPYGLYWYAKPGKDFKKHAQNFWIKWHEAPGDLPPCFDLEETGGLLKTALDGWLQKMYNEFNQLAGIGAAEEMTYTSPGWCDRALGQVGWLKWTKLWVAHWTTASEPALPKEWAVPGMTWENWQWSAVGKGSDYGATSRYIDLDRGKFELPQPPTPPGGDELKMQVTADVLNVRDGPGTTYADVGDLHAGDVVDLLNVGGTGAWVQIKGGQYDGKWICVQLSSSRYCEPVS